ncbi:protein LONGIFOLIA 2 isoform X1 [Selaginella moellendorffii]|uniref:protein LONGIFOLIA 2 isoform X1 n=1 Tax=Selaginella moellendorffii TaxID=88036 RepID=UPI000D1CC710|nr:protein LONGIFOLIA 2 isoform X1 [Selaginella moellendorffii]|eukprot:XP_024537615.1 protein LONGIFOLIA 2 isoform X1 [Selaginella moellendorffii]
MGRKSKPAPAYHDVPGCFNGIWNGAPESEDTTPVVLARKSLSERKFSEGFEAPRNSLDISSAVFESMRQNHVPASAPSDEIPFGFEFALRKSTDKAPPRVSVPNPSAASMDSRCRSPSVIARLMGLDTLPAEQPLPQLKRQATSKQTSQEELQLLSSERRSLLTSRSTKERYSGSHEQVRHQQLTRQLSCNGNSKLKEWPPRTEQDEFLLFDVLPFRDHPQEKQLEKLKQEFQAQRHRKSQMEEQFSSLQMKQRAAKVGNSGISVPEKLLEAVTNTNRQPGEPKEMLDAIQFLQSNKEFLVKFLQEPNSVFARHVYDLQALAAKEAAAEEEARNKSRSLHRTPKEIVTQQQDNIGFSRKLVEPKKDRDLTRGSSAKKQVVQKQQRKGSIERSQVQDDSKIILLKPNAKPNSTPARTPTTPRSMELAEDGVKKSRCLKNVSASTTDPREMARQIAKQVRENVTKELEQKNSKADSKARSRAAASTWSFDGIEMAVGGCEGSEPSSRRYPKDYQVYQSTASLPSSPKLSSRDKVPAANVSSKEGRKQLMQKLKLAAEANQSDDESSRDSSVSIQIEIVPAAKQQEYEQPKKHKGGKLLKLFSRDSQKSASDDSPRLLVRSKSVSSLVEEQSPGPAEVLERTHSCSSSRSSIPDNASSSISTASTPKGKFSSLKSSLLGKKKSHTRTPSDASELVKPSPEKQQVACRTIEHSVSSAFEDHYIRTFRKTEAQLAGSYERCNSDKVRTAVAIHPSSTDESYFAQFDQSPRFLSLDITGGLDHLETSSDIHTEKSEQPSPVSVLERGFIEESPSPVSFEDASSDLQELQMRLERLKLDESGRTQNVGHLATTEKQEFVPASSPAAAKADLSSLAPLRSRHCSPTSQDHLYISKLIHASGFSNSLGSLFAWHSPTYPIDPYLFAKLEEDYVCSEEPSPCQPGKRRSSRSQRKLKIGRTFTQVQRRPETLHRQMLFDVVNEVLSQKFQHLWDDRPSLTTGKEGIRPIPSGKYLLHEIDKAISLYRHEYDTVDYSLENLVERDVNISDQWMDTSNDLRKIGAEVEVSIFNSLVEELAYSLIR